MDGVITAVPIVYVPPLSPPGRQQPFGQPHSFDPHSRANWPSGPSSWWSSTEAGRRAAAGRRQHPPRAAPAVISGPPPSTRACLGAEFGQQRQHGDQLQQLGGPLLRPDGGPDRLQRARLRPRAVRRSNQSSSTRTPPTWKSQASAGTGEMRPVAQAERLLLGVVRRSRRAAAGTAARTYGRRPPGSLGRSPPRAPRSWSRSSRRPSSTPAPTSGSAGSGTTHPAAEGAAAASDPGEDVVGVDLRARTGVPQRGQQTRREVGLHATGPPVQRPDPAGPSRRGAPVGQQRRRRRRPGPRPPATHPCSTTKTCRSSATRHSSGRAASISRWSGISHCSSKAPCSTRTGSGQGPYSRANRPVPVDCPGSWLTAECAAYARGSARTAPRARRPRPSPGRPSGPSGRPASGAVTHARPEPQAVRRTTA